MDYRKKPGQKIELIGELENNEKPTVSIITSFYNGGKTLMETANAVFSQTYPYFEWIIVDDGSKDDESLKKLDKLEKMDKRIKVFHKENGGPSVARDFGIENSSKDTKYIFFLDCDDIPDHTMLESLYWTLETHEDASFAYTTMVNFGDREFIWEKYLTVEQEIVDNLICIASLVRKEDLLEVGCFGIKEKSMYEDWNLWLKLLSKGKKPVRVDAPIFWYRVSNTGEFSRAQKNNDNAMKYVNATGKTIEEDVDIIQFPREGKKYDTVKNHPDMVLPEYKKSKKKKILYLFPWMVVGGADLFNLDLLKRIDHEKYQSIVLTTLPSDNPLRQQFEEYSEEVWDMSTFLERSDYINFVDYIIESRKVDAVVISNTRYGYYMLPYLKGKYPTIPFIDYIHSIDLKDPREGFGRCSKDVDKYLTKTYCCNNFTKNQLIERYGKKNVETLYIGTDADKFNPKKFDKDKLKEKYEVPKDKKIVSFIARLSEEKRPEMFVEICKRLQEKRNDLYMVIAGDGYLMPDIEKVVTDDFKLLGMVKNTEEIYAISDLTINCSTLEGLALTSYESLSMGVPVVSTDVGGQTELIDEKVGGIVHCNINPSKEVYNNEINEYVKEVDRVLNNLDKISKNCRKKIEEGFTLDLMIEKYQNIIEESINNEKNTTKQDNTYIEYELALEALHKQYYFYCKNYLEPKFDIYYDYVDDTTPVKVKAKGKKFKIKQNINKFLVKHNAKHEGTIILDWLRSIKRLLKETIISIKFFFKSIVAGLKLIFKIIFR